MEAAVAIVGTVVGLVVLAWFAWETVRVEGPFGTTSEENRPGAPVRHQQDPSRGADRPAGPGAESELVVRDGEASPGPPGQDSLTTVAGSRSSRSPR